MKNILFLLGFVALTISTQAQHVVQYYYGNTMWTGPQLYTYCNYGRAYQVVPRYFPARMSRLSHYTSLTHVGSAMYAGVSQHQIGFGMIRDVITDKYETISTDDLECVYTIVSVLIVITE